MTLVRPHAQRYSLVEQLQTMDPVADAHAIYRATSVLDLAWETRIGLNLAFYRSYAVPRIATLIAHTGELASKPDKRSFDTGLWMYELIEHGLDHPRGREVVRGLNRMHRRWDIANEDYAYILASMLIVPIRFIDQAGWRKSTEVERAAATNFYRRLGEMMGIKDLPQDYAGFTRLFDDYENQHVGFSQAGAAHMAATQQVMAKQLGPRAGVLAALVTRALLEDHIDRAVGLRPPPPGARLALRTGLALRAAKQLRQPPAQVSWFTPGRTIAGVYPNGYELKDLGPDWLREQRTAGH